MLKYSLITVLFSCIIVNFSSCVQSYDCECITIENGIEVFRATDTYMGSKKSTQKICDRFEKDVNSVGQTPDKYTECTLK